MKQGRIKRNRNIVFSYFLFHTVFYFWNEEYSPTSLEEEHNLPVNQTEDT